MQDGHRRFRITNTFIEVSDSDSDDGLPGRLSLRASSAPRPETRGPPLPRPRGAQAQGEPPPGGLARGGSAAGSGMAAEAGGSPHDALDPVDSGLAGAGVASAASWPERDAQVEPGAQSSSTSETHASDQSLTMGEAVRALTQEDTGCLFLVRRVNALGFESEELLRSHYSSYGRVRRVLVVHSRSRCWSGSGTLSSRMRLRPGSMAFVVMEDPVVVERIICQVGREQTVAGKRVRVERFARSTFA